MQLSEHDEGAHPGALPAALPEGEQLLWQGRPSARGLARQNFHVLGVGLYFLALLIWRTLSVAAEPGNGLAEGLSAASVLVMPFLAAEAVLLLLAWGYARSTIYTLTSARLAIRSGLAVPVTTTIAFELVEGAALKRHGKGVRRLCHWEVRFNERIEHRRTQRDRRTQVRIGRDCPLERSFSGRLQADDWRVSCSEGSADLLH